MIFMDIFYIALSVYVLATTLYLMVITAAAFFFKKKTAAPPAVFNIAVLIPAHNEALGIGGTIQGIRAMHYAKERCGIFVIADNCDDNTAELARQAGAEVMERFDPGNRGKGQALDWFLKSQRDMYDKFDAVAIIDADTRPHADFLTEISATLSHGDVEVVQGFYGVLNPCANWRTALSSAALYVFHHLRPAGRNRIGASAGLKGNGMAFRTRILENGWPAFSIVEDIEFSLHLLLKGILVHYNPDAIVYGEMASGASQAATQRKRWEGGRLGLLKKYTPSLLISFAKDRTLAFLDAVMELLTPPLSILVLGQILLLIVSIAAYPTMIPVWSLCLFGVACYVFSGLILKRAPLYVWGALLCAPIFVLWKIPVYWNLIKQGRSDAWERTAREAEIKKEDS